MELHALGERKISEFLFSIEVKNAKVLTNIRGMNMARDFVDILNESKTIRTLLENGHFTFSMAKDYILKINVVSAPVETESVENQEQTEVTLEAAEELNSLDA